VTNTKSAKPGDTLLLWGTGLGAVTGGDAIVPTGNIDAGLSIQVWVGGVSAAVAYRGRSAAPGLDQINFVVPPGLSGCSVSLAVQTGATLSNYTTMPIAPNGGPCSDANSIASSPALVSLLSKSSSNIFVFNVDQSNDIRFQGATTSVDVKSFFAHFGQGELTAQAKDLFRTPSLGSCAVTIHLTNGGDDGTQFSTLDVGTSVTVTPPAGTPLTLSQVGKGAFQAAPTTPLPAGAYTESNGKGGADIGPLTVNFTIPPFVRWTNSNTFSGLAIDRTKGLTVNWTGGGSDPTNYVLVHGDTGFGGQGGNSDIQFDCAAPATAGQFTVPPAVLSAFPVEPGGLLQVGTSSTQIIAVPGFDGGLILATDAASVGVSWK
jgi:hypothetical protein